MKYTGLLLRTLCLVVLLPLSHTATALVLLDIKLPAALQSAYQSRNKDPLSCIDSVGQYMLQKGLAGGFAPGSEEEKKARRVYASATHLQAFCYAQIEDYANTLSLLQPLLKQNTASAEQITTLNIIALELPEEERRQLTNQLLLEMLYQAAQKTTMASPTQAVILQLTIAHLSLQINRYRDAYTALETAQELIRKKYHKELYAWLNYYHGLYYEHINQPQLSISSFLTANTLADKHSLIKLSGQVKRALADVYQKKHRFQTALNFSSQQVELYQSTANTSKQAASLIQHAILKRQNNENNQSLIYLFNALELIQINKNTTLLAHLYLELGHSYLNSKDEQSNHLQLAQKYLQNARFHFTRLNKPRYQIESLLLLAKLNIMKNDSALAILQLEKVLQLSENNYLSLRAQAFEMLALSYELTGNHQQANLHFKNFHALQNRIKEYFFELQQLQISEQLQLFENTQQQKQLQVKNTQLQKTAERYQMLAYSSISLLILISLLFFYTLKRNKKLNNAHQDAQQRLAFHPRTKLPFQYVDSHHFQYTYHGSPLYYALLNIPFLSQLNELLGTYGAMKIERKLGEELQMYFNCKVDIFQFRGNQILFIAEQKEYKSAGDFAQNIEDFFTSFCNKQQLSNTVSCGIVAFPFLNNASRALSPSKTLNLSSLALFAASQIRKQKQQSSWVELYAIDNLQPAFLNGDLWRLGQRAIDKGIIKINTSHPGFKFNWPNHRN